MKDERMGNSLKRKTKEHCVYFFLKKSLENRKGKKIPFVWNIANKYSKVLKIFY